MSRDFRDRFGMMQDNDPTGQQQEDSSIQERYPAQSHARNIVFVLRDGRRCFLNYSYLVCTELPDNENLLLHFTTHTVTLTGKGLDALFLDLSAHIPRIIACTDPRYDLLAEGQPVVHQISVAAKG